MFCKILRVSWHSASSELILAYLFSGGNSFQKSLWEMLDYSKLQKGERTEYRWEKWAKVKDQGKTTCVASSLHFIWKQYGVSNEFAARRGLLTNPQDRKRMSLLSLSTAPANICWAKRLVNCDSGRRVPFTMSLHLSGPRLSHLHDDPAEYILSVDSVDYYAR